MIDFLRKKIFRQSEQQAEIQLPVLSKTDIPTGGKILITTNQKTHGVRVAFVLNEYSSRIGVLDLQEAAEICADNVFLDAHAITVEYPEKLFWMDLEYARIARRQR